MRTLVPALVLAALAACTASSSPSGSHEDASSGKVESERGVLPASASRALDEPEREIVDDFALLDEAGGYHALYEQRDARAVVLVAFATGSPTSARLAAEVEELARAYGERGVRFFYVDSTPLQGREAVAAAARELGTTLPVLCDSFQWVRASLGFERVAEALVVDPADWSVAYRGPLRGGEHAYVDAALAALLDGRSVPNAHREPAADAEPIAFDELPVPSFAADVVPILERRCLECHSKGGIAPWAMDSFAHVRGWSPAIREAILTKRMPPWHADPHFGSFANDRSLTALEGRTLLAWIDAGSPRGEGADALPELGTVDKPEWSLGEPDIVVEAKHVDIPAAGLVPYVYATVDLELTKDVWVRATDVRPGNPRILHHAQIYIRYPDELKSEEPKFNGAGANVFSWYTPGSAAHEFPKDTGKLLPAGSKLVFQLHYTTTGKVESDETKLALYLHDAPPRVAFDSTSAVGWNLKIPPLEPRHLELAERTFKKDVFLYSMSVHMHYRGRAMDFRAIHPDGTEEMVLSVPRYDFNWQTTYRLAEPLLLPAGTTIACRAVYDNSPQNPFNPDPTREVVWGLQTTDEMFIGNLDVYEVFPSGTSSAASRGASGSGADETSTDSR